MVRRNVPTRIKLKKLIKEEEMSSKEYKRFGFKRLSKDESSHAKFLKEELRKKKK